MRRIESYRDLGPNWDGYGAIPIKPRAIKAALDIVRVLCDHRELQELSAPDVDPETNGTISMTWETVDNYAYLEIGETRYAGYAKRCGCVSCYFDGPVDYLTEGPERNPLYTIHLHIISHCNGTKNRDSQ